MSTPGHRRLRAGIVAGIATAATLALAAAGLWLLRFRPVVVAVGVDEPLLNGAVIDPSDRNAADLYLEDHPRSRIRLISHFNPPDPADGPGSIAALKQRGVRLFVNTQASSHAVPSLPQFRDGQALAINVSSVSNALSHRDDFFLRIVPDLTAEQQAVAREIERLPGRRLLVLQDTGNRAYTDPAFRVLAATLARSGRWRIERRELAITHFDARNQRHLVEGEFDALYVLGGSFLPIIGNLCQLFHTLHPSAPILLTPWARSPQVFGSAGPAAARIRLISPYPPRRRDPRVEAFLRRFERRFGYTPYAMALGTHQALELLDQALASGASTPTAVKRHLLSRSEHPTTFGPIRFDASGDVQAQYSVFGLADDLPPATR
ncbi:MAG: ABC transporter substrate-binding protein [Synechococcaceae cyanobacterium]|nr:ABC transporter substrate-binding protein [Synechococcaceae cyanobacterium]